LDWCIALFAFKIVAGYCICTRVVHLVRWGVVEGVEDHLVGFKIASLMCFVCKINWYSGKLCIVVQRTRRRSCGRV